MILKLKRNTVKMITKCKLFFYKDFKKEMSLPSLIMFGIVDPSNTITREKTYREFPKNRKSNFERVEIKKII